MRPAELGRSAFFRFALALTLTFLAAYLVAGIIAFRAINSDLHNRVVRAVELSVERYEDTFLQAGVEGLISSAESRARLVDADDEFIWLGSRDGATVVGRQSPVVTSLTTGEVTGAALGTDPDDKYWVVVRDFGELRLVTGQSFEESEAIGRRVLGAFGGATALIILLAGTSATLLARRAQRRLDRISSTLADFALGNMSSRVPRSGSDDDLDRLASRINDALGQLETTVDGIRQVSTDIAHDLRTPISRLGILMEEMLADTQGHPVLQERLETVAVELKQITAIFDSLLRIAQIEAGARKSRFRAVALPEIAISLHEAYLPVAEENDQQLCCNIATSAAAAILGDHDLLTQLFANLVENAIRHCPPGAEILLEVGSGADGVWMSVSDDGPGIPPGEFANITKRFYRLEKARHTAGSGLGLALVKAIADLHGASLQLEDNHPGLIVRLVFEPHQPMSAA